MTFNINLTDNTSSRAEKLPDVLEVTMELEEHNPRFMAAFKRFEPKIKDSTAIKAVKECPRKYFYQIVLGRQSNDNNVVFAWGTAYHKFREHLEKIYGIARTPYNTEAARNAFAEAGMIAVRYWKEHGQDQHPDSKFPQFTTERFLKSLKVAFEFWEREKKEGRIIVIASEQAFNVQLDDGSWIGGRADQMLEWNGVLWGRDFKTTSKDSAFFARSLEPNDQFTRYTLADTKLSGKFVQGQVVELLYNGKPTKQDPKGPQVIPLLTSRTPEQLDIFEKEQTVINKQLAIYRETDVWPMHESSCPFCPYHSVCKMPTESGQMAQLEQNYSLRPWDFSKVGVSDD